MASAVLTLNAGSSSVKFSLWEFGRAESPGFLARGEVEEIEATPRFHACDRHGVHVDETWTGATFEACFDRLLAWSEKRLDGDSLVAVGHRVVHGGPDHAAPEPVTPALIALLDELRPFAPLHLPHNVAPMRVLLASRPDLLQVACFDTAFHQTIPFVARRFALPREFEAAGVLSYGFHGLSYEFVARRLRDIDPALAAGRVIVAHLGAGASLCAMRDGRSIETTMAFSTLDGLVMGTRCGSLDPGVLLYLMQERGMDSAQIEDLLYRRSGLLGLSGGLSADMRTLLASDDLRAHEAIDVFVYRIAHFIGALASALGGLDGIVFTAGIGENSPEVRARVCARLAWLGAVIDPTANLANAALIGASHARFRVHVVPTDEEAMIASHTVEISDASRPEARSTPAVAPLT